jgi:hypothetical protein
MRVTFSDALREHGDRGVNHGVHSGPPFRAEVYAFNGSPAIVRNNFFNKQFGLLPLVASTWFAEVPRDIGALAKLITFHHTGETTVDGDKMFAAMLIVNTSNLYVTDYGHEILSRSLAPTKRNCLDVMKGAAISESAKKSGVGRSSSL